MEAPVAILSHSPPELQKSYEIAVASWSAPVLWHFWSGARAVSQPQSGRALPHSKTQAPNNARQWTNGNGPHKEAIPIIELMAFGCSR
jgi:hypothetical protein